MRPLSNPVWFTLPSFAQAKGFGLNGRRWMSESTANQNALTLTNPIARARVLEQLIATEIGYITSLQKEHQNDLNAGITTRRRRIERLDQNSRSYEEDKEELISAIGRAASDASKIQVLKLRHWTQRAISEAQLAYYCL